MSRAAEIDSRPVLGYHVHICASPPGSSDGGTQSHQLSRVPHRRYLLSEEGLGGREVVRICRCPRTSHQHGAPYNELKPRRCPLGPQTYMSRYPIPREVGPGSSGPLGPLQGLPHLPSAQGVECLTRILGIRVFSRAWKEIPHWQRGVDRTALSISFWRYHHWVSRLGSGQVLEAGDRLEECSP